MSTTSPPIEVVSIVEPPDLIVTTSLVGPSGPQGPPGPAGPAGSLVLTPTTDHDTFGRANGVLDGTLAPSGGTYTVEGTGTKNQIVGGVYAPNVTPGTADVQVLHLPFQQTLTAVTGEFTFTAGGTTTTHNVVIGAAPGNFGAAGGSIQLSWNAAGLWQLFSFVPTVYTILGQGNLAAPVVGTRYRMTMTRTGYNTVVLELPDGSLQTITDPNVSLRWGNQAGWQTRRPATTDGTAVFSMAGWKRTSPLPTAVPGALRLDTPAGYPVTTPKPPGWTIGDLDIRLIAIPDTWAVAGTPVLCGQNPQASWAITTTGASILNLQYRYDGVTVNTANSSAAIPAGTNGVRITRTVSDGVITLYTSTDLGATWTQLGVTRASTAGPLYNPTPNSGNAMIQLGKFTGQLRSFTIMDGVGGPVAASVDLTRPWPGAFYTDPAGNTWTLAPDLWRWATAPTLQTVSALPTAAAANRGQSLMVPGNGTTTPDTVYTCLLAAAGTYSWKPIATG
jgi:hypothetical protein